MEIQARSILLGTLMNQGTYLFKGTGITVRNISITYQASLQINVDYFLPVHYNVNSSNRCKSQLPYVSPY